MYKNEIVETQEAIEIIIDALCNSYIKLTDSLGNLNIYLDENAKHLLETYYKSKLKDK